MPIFLGSYFLHYRPLNLGIQYRLHNKDVKGLKMQSDIYSSIHMVKFYQQHYEKKTGAITANGDKSKID